MFLSPILLIVVAIIVTLIFIKANTISFIVQWILLSFHSLKKNWMWIATIVIVAFGVFKWQSSKTSNEDYTSNNTISSSNSSNSDDNNSKRECKNCNGTGLAPCPRCKGTGIDHFGSSTGDKCYCITQYQNAIKKGRKPLHPPLRWKCAYCDGTGIR